MGHFNMITRQTMADSSKKPYADDRGPSNQSFISLGTKWKEQFFTPPAWRSSELGLTGGQMRTSRTIFRVIIATFPREKKNISGILAKRIPTLEGLARAHFPNSAVRLLSLTSNRRPHQANGQQFERKIENRKEKS